MNQETHITPISKPYARFDDISMDATRDTLTRIHVHDHCEYVQEVMERAVRELRLTLLESIMRAHPTPMHDVTHGGVAISQPLPDGAIMIAGAHDVTRGGVAIPQHLLDGAIMIACAHDDADMFAFLEKCFAMYQDTIEREYMVGYPGPTRTSGMLFPRIFVRHYRSGDYCKSERARRIIEATTGRTKEDLFLINGPLVQSYDCMFSCGRESPIILIANSEELIRKHLAQTDNSVDYLVLYVNQFDMWTKSLRGVLWYVHAIATCGQFARIEKKVCSWLKFVPLSIREARAYAEILRCAPDTYAIKAFTVYFNDPIFSPDFFVLMAHIARPGRDIIRDMFLTTTSSVSAARTLVQLYPSAAHNVEIMGAHYATSNFSLAIIAGAPDSIQYTVICNLIRHGMHQVLARLIARDPKRARQIVEESRDTIYEYLALGFMEHGGSSDSADVTELMVRDLTTIYPSLPMYFIERYMCIDERDMPGSAVYDGCDHAGGHVTRACLAHGRYPDLSTPTSLFFESIDMWNKVHPDCSEMMVMLCGRYLIRAARGIEQMCDFPVENPRAHPDAGDVARSKRIIALFLSAFRGSEKCRALDDVVALYHVIACDLIMMVQSYQPPDADMTHLACTSYEDLECGLLFANIESNLEDLVMTMRR
jgi:hypothetical protein